MFGKKDFPDGLAVTTKLRAGDYMIPATILKTGTRLFVKHKYNKKLQAEIKSLEGAHYHGYDETNPKKEWSIDDSPHNHFQLSYLDGSNPYAHYDKPLIPYTPRRSLYAHQVDLVSHIITRQYCILASEMGTGKTLACIEAMEWLATNRGIVSWFYVAPKSALTSVQLEFDLWKAMVVPQFITYDELKGIIAHWPADQPPPQAVIFDESSRLKNPTSLRSQSSMHLANSIREEWGDDGCVIEMSGSPAPKSPVDWWSQCSIACPGFLKEGSLEKFRKNLAVMGEGESITGGKFAKLVSWLDDESKCNICGGKETDIQHDTFEVTIGKGHVYEKSVNEIARLYKRMIGLVIVKFKKDCLDLPEKQYKIIDCKPTQAIINAAKLITARGGPVLQVMMLLRELSDGFQYEDTEMGTEKCPSCKGDQYREDWEYIGSEDDYDMYQEQMLSGQELPATIFRKIKAACAYCNGTGEITRFVREAVQVPCPKEAKLEEQFDLHDDVGRMIVYAGFTGSVDRCRLIAQRLKWDYIRVDGRGWSSSFIDNPTAKEMLKRFQFQKEAFPRIVFIGQPGAAGMGLNLTASPTIVYYSNDFIGESRIQSEDRIHRPGMDLNRGATIIDLIHLPTDLKVLKNLKEKRRLQDISLGEFKSALDDTAIPTER